MTGLRLPIDRIRRRLRKLNSITRAIDFKPELLQYAKVTLQTCADATPERDSGTISTAQQAQYLSRINYIPTNHRLENPTLIVKNSGDHLLFLDGKWYHPMQHKMPAIAWSRYQELLSERNRRISRINREKFVSDRVQARGLYKRSWTQVAKSLGVRVSAGDAERSVNRRRPSQEPPRAYAYVQGAKRTISIPVFNRFLEIHSNYKPFSGKAILASAQAKHRPEFKRIVENKVRRLITAARRV